MAPVRQVVEGSAAHEQNVPLDAIVATINGADVTGKAASEATALIAAERRAGRAVRLELRTARRVVQV